MSTTGIGLPPIDGPRTGIATIYVGGRFCKPRGGPSGVSFTPSRHETLTKMSDLSIRVDRPNLGPGFASVLTLESLGIQWDDLRDLGLLGHIGVLQTMGLPFDVCAYRPLTEIFAGDGDNKTFYLRRRPADPILGTSTIEPWQAGLAPQIITCSSPYGSQPGNVWVKLDATFKTTSDIDTGDPGATEAWINGDGEQVGGKTVTKLRLGAAPNDGNDTLLAVYTPMFKMVPDGDPGKNYTKALVESHSLRLTEI